MREFESGATRDNTEGKYDLEGFFSPAVLNRYAEFMNKHRKQADGKLRDSDNWQKGIPLDVYMKSAFRHFFDWWANHRHVESVIKEDVEESLCALIFNAMGYLHEYLKDKDSEYNAAEIDGPVVYVPQPGDIIFITLRETIYYGLAESVEENNHVGVIIEGTDNLGLRLYKTKIGKSEFNIYVDEMQLLKREDN